MIKIVHHQLETQIVLNENTVNILSVENQTLLYTYVSDFLSQFNGEEGNFVFSDEKIIKPDELGEFVSSAFHVEFNGKRIQTLVMKKLLACANSGERFAQFVALKSELLRFFTDISDDMDIMLEYNDEPDIASVLKLGHFELRSEHLSLSEMLAEYVNILVELKNLHFIVFYGIRLLLNDEDLRALYKHCEYKKVCVLLIEGKLDRSPHQNEKVIIIDNDLCEILVNYK